MVERYQHFYYQVTQFQKLPLANGMIDNVLYKNGRELSGLNESDTLYYFKGKLINNLI